MAKCVGVELLSSSVNVSVEAGKFHTMHMKAWGLSGVPRQYRYLTVVAQCKTKEPFEILDALRQALFTLENPINRRRFAKSNDCRDVISNRLRKAIQSRVQHLIVRVSLSRGMYA